ncbi:metallophosphoesterase [Salinigranum salinum]|uniref:metallophosphoesterase n=1 Tax=Salinigranum salinum TaxID=1364937 RepID=UPI0012611BDA|nr:metallophosphoesterase [Salinigranum salinum]
MFHVAFYDRSLYVPLSSTLVVADLHVGRADASDVNAPLGEGADLVERLGGAVDAFAPEQVVFAGDVLHEFGRVGSGARETLTTLTEVCRDAGARPVMVAGNHDGVLSTVWDGPIHDAYVVDGGEGDVVVCHGHEEPVETGQTGAGGGEGDDADTETADATPALYVVGHDHPAITIEGQKRPCFLYGEGVYRGGDLLMLPAFTRVAAGVAVNGMRSRDFQSPLVRDADALRPIVWDQSTAEALWFPPLGRFRRLL